MRCKIKLALLPSAMGLSELSFNLFPVEVFLLDSTRLRPSASLSVIICTILLLLLRYVVLFGVF